MTKRLNESGSIMEAANGGRRAVLISQGLGSSGYYGPEFFTEENARALAGALSFPGHPDWDESPSERNPLSAIGMIDEAVEVETDESGNKRFVSTYHVAKSKPDVSEYLDEFGRKLGLSIFIEGDGEYDSTTGLFHVKTLNGEDPYRSVDLVVAAGRGGTLLEGASRNTKNSLVEAQRRLAALAQENASAPAEEKNEEDDMTVEEKIAANTAAIESLTSKIDALVTAKEEAAKADLQAQVDDAAVQTAVEARLEQFAADSALINEAGLTESQQAEAMALAKSGGDVKSFVEAAKKVLDEARAIVESNKSGGRPAVGHVTGSIKESAPIGAAVPGFGKVR